MDGFLVIDKPCDMTSFDVVAQVRRILNPREKGSPSAKLRVGHLGTLDPLATGVLVLAVGQGTKLIEYLMGADKTYEVQLEFGKVSDTYDTEGDVTIVNDAQPVERADFEKALLSFVGDIQQIPPAFSAIKVAGRRAYDLARKGQVPDLKSRPVTIHSIKVRGFRFPFAELEVYCGSGTYIRSLVHDLGKALASGAIVTGLRRLVVDGFTLDQACPGEAYVDHLIPLERVVADWPRLDLKEAQYRTLKYGQMIPLPPTLRGTLEEAVFPLAAFYEDRLVSLLEMHRGRLRVLKNFC